MIRFANCNLPLVGFRHSVIEPTPFIVIGGVIIKPSGKTIVFLLFIL